MNLLTNTSFRKQLSIRFQCSTEVCRCRSTEHLDALLDASDSRNTRRSTSHNDYQTASLHHSLTRPPPYSAEPESGYSTFDSRRNQNPSYSSDTSGTSSTGATEAINAIPFPPSEFEDEPVPDYETEDSSRPPHRAPAYSEAASGSRQAPDPRPSGGDNGPSAFDLSIRRAAEERERRRSRDAVVAPAAIHKSSPPPPRAAPPANIPIPPPPPPLPPLPGANPPPRVSQTATENGEKSIPVKIQKQLHGTKKQEDSHAALMAAVLRRRMAIDPSDSEESSDVIESQVNRTRKVQPARGVGEPVRKEVRAPVQPVPLAMLGSLNKPTSPRSQHGGNATNGLAFWLLD